MFGKKHNRKKISQQDIRDRTSKKAKKHHCCTAFKS